MCPIRSHIAEMQHWSRMPRSLNGSTAGAADGCCPSSANNNVAVMVPVSWTGGARRPVGCTTNNNNTVLGANNRYDPCRAGNVVIGTCNAAFPHDYCVMIGHGLPPATEDFEINIGNRIVITRDGMVLNAPKITIDAGEGGTVINGPVSIPGWQGGGGVGGCNNCSNCQLPVHQGCMPSAWGPAKTLDLSGVAAAHEFFDNVIVHTDLYVSGRMTLPHADINGSVVVHNEACHAWKMFVTEGKDLALQSKNGTTVTFCEEFHSGVLNFTGSHMLHVAGGEEDRNRILPGHIVCCSGAYVDMKGSRGRTTVDDALPEVRLSRTKRDPTAFGVFSRWERDSFRLGNVRFPLPPGSVPPRGRGWAVVNSVGEGCVMVCDEAGDLRNGDLVCTSSHAGMGMRQGDDVVRSITVAKVTSDCVFGAGPVRVVSVGGGRTVRARLVGCVYKF